MIYKVGLILMGFDFDFCHSSWRLLALARNDGIGMVALVDALGGYHNLAQQKAIMKRTHIPAVVRDFVRLLFHSHQGGL